MIPEDRLKTQREMTLPEFIDQVGDKLGVPKPLRDAIFQNESNYNHYGANGEVKRSPKGALGVGQLMPGTAKKHGVDPLDPIDNAFGALKEQKELYDKYLNHTGDVNQAALLTAAAYNAGSGAVDKYGTIPPYAETQDYVRKVAAHLKRNPITPTQNVLSQPPAPDGHRPTAAPPVTEPPGTASVSLAEQPSPPAPPEVVLPDAATLPGVQEAAASSPVAAPAEAAAADIRFKPGFEEALAASIKARPLSSDLEDLKSRVDFIKQVADSGRDLKDPEVQRQIASGQVKASTSTRLGAKHAAPSADDLIVRAAIRDKPKLINDLLWHFGPDALDAMAKATPAQRRQMVAFATKAAAQDQVKRNQGQQLKQSASYQNENRARLGMPPVAAFGMGDVQQASRETSPSIADIKRGEEKPIEAQQIVADEMKRSGPGLATLAQRLQRRGVDPQTVGLATAETENLSPAEVLKHPASIGSHIDLLPARERPSEAQQIIEERLGGKDAISQRIAQQWPRFLAYTDQLGAKLSKLAGKVVTLPDTNASGSVIAEQLPDYLEKRAQMWDEVARHAPANLNWPQKAIRTAIDGGYDVARISAMVETSGLSLPTAMVGESMILNSDKDYATQAKEAAKAYAFGWALSKLPVYAQRGVGQIPGIVGRTAVAHPEMVARTIGAISFAPLSGVAEYERGGSASDIAAATAGGAVLGAGLAGGGLGKLKEVPDVVIASERSPEWLRQVAAKATGKVPVVVQSEGPQPRYASVYVNPETNAHVTREITFDEAQGLLSKSRRVHTVPEAQFEQVLGPSASEPAAQPVAPLNRQIEAETGKTRNIIPAEPELSESANKISTGATKPGTPKIDQNITGAITEGGPHAEKPATSEAAIPAAGDEAGPERQVSGALPTPENGRTAAAGSVETTETASPAGALGRIQPKTIVRHSDPNIDGGEVVGRAPDGRLKVQNKEGGISLVQDPRKQGNREAALVKESAPAPDEQIVTAAIRQPDGSVVTGKNHPQILLSQGKQVPKDRSGAEYGFVTTTGRFVSREEAAKIAKVPNTIKEGSLYTEDLTAAKQAPQPRDRRQRQVQTLRAERRQAREERRKLTEQVAVERRAGQTDRLTGLANQGEWLKAKDAAEADPNTTILSVDYDNFKTVNDELGHAEGDKVLAEGASIARDVAAEHPEARVYRSGGDEVALTVPNDKAEAIQKAIEQKGVQLRKVGDTTVSLSVGRGNTMVDADADMYARKRAKANGNQAKAEAPGERHPVTGRKFSSTQIDLPGEAAALQKKAANKIHDADLKEVDGTTREDRPHVTVKYGLHTDDADELRQVLADEGPIKLTIGKMSIFPAKEGTDYDVVKMDVDSPDLHRLNAKISKSLPVTDTHPEYKPHVTLAYVKPGAGAKYVGKENALTGKEITVDKILFSSKSGKEIQIPLVDKTPAKEPIALRSTQVNQEASGEERSKKVSDYFDRLIRRSTMDEAGQARLDDMIEAGVSPEDVSKEFWENTYFKLSGPAQERFQRYLKDMLGWKPGDVIATDKDGNAITAKDWFDIAENADLGDDAEYLEGVQRGYVVLMNEANEMAKKLPAEEPSRSVTKVVKQIGSSSKNKEVPENAQQRSTGLANTPTVEQATADTSVAGAAPKSQTAPASELSVDTTAAEAQNAAREQTSATESEPAIREPRAPKSTPVIGKATRVKIPGTSRAYESRYVVREAADVVPSHNPFNFQPDPEYHYLNDRRYDREPQYQTQVIDRSKSSGTEAFDAAYVINNSPTAENGPPIIDADGNVLGGNSRAMIVKRVYGSDDKAAERAYRETLFEQAPIFGLEPKQVAAMSQPMLVREIDDEQLAGNTDIQRAITELNVPSTTPLTQEEASAAAAQQISDDAAQFITDMIDTEGEDATIASVMDSKGAAIVNRLIEDGIFKPGDRNRLLKNGKSTPEAKSRVESILVGGLYKDLAQMQATPAGVRRNIERVVVPMRKIAGDPDWDLADDLKSAIDAVIEARATGLGQDFEKLRIQSSMVRRPFTDKEIALAKILVMGPVKTAKRFRAYAHDFEEAQIGQNLFGAPPTQGESEELHLGDRAPQGALKRSAQLGFTQEGLLAQEAPERAPRFESPIVRQASEQVQKVFGSTPAGRPLLDVIRERGGTDIRAIIEVLERNAGRFNEQAGQDFARSLDKLATLRATNTPVDDFLRQGSFFGKELTDEQESLLIALDKGGPKFVNRYVSQLAGGSVSREGIERAAEPEPSAQSALFRGTNDDRMSELARPSIQTRDLLGNLAHVYRNGTFYVNPHTLELLRRVEQIITAQTVQPFDGSFIDRELLKFYVGTLRELGDLYPDQRAAALDLARQLKAASNASLRAGASGGVPVVGIFAGDAPVSLRKVIQHERAHESSEAGAKGEPYEGRVDVEKLAAHPVSQKIFSALVDTYGYEDNKARLIEEAQAWLMSKDGVTDLGLTEAEAGEWLKAYFQSFSERNGTDSLKRWQKIRPAAAKVRDDVFRKLQTTQAVSSGEAGGDERSQPGIDGDISKRRPRRDGSRARETLHRRRPGEGTDFTREARQLAGVEPIPERISPENSFESHFGAEPEETDVSATLGEPNNLAPDPIVSDQDPELVHAMALSNARMPMAQRAEVGFEKSRVPAAEVIKSYEAILKALGKPTPIRVGHMAERSARGIYKPHVEVIRLRTADNLPTAAHETGHAIQKAIYGSTQSAALAKTDNKVKRELVSLGKALYGNTRPNGGYRTEGFAEFMRYYLTRDDVATVAPETTKYFESQVLPNNPDLATSLTEARKKTDAFRKQGAANRARASLQGKPSLKERIESAIEAAKRLPDYMLDEFAPLMRLSDAVADIHGPLPVTEDPGKVASYLRGSPSAKVQYMVEDGMLDFAGNRVGGPLAEAAAIVKGKQRGFTAYLWARRAQERWSKGKNPGMSLEDANALVEEMGSPEFQLAAQKVYDWNAGVLQYVREAAPDLAPAIDKILADSENYVPLSRVFKASEVKTGKPSQRQAAGNPLKKMKGSGRAIKDIFPQLIANAHRMISMAHKRRLLDTIVRLSDREGVGHLIEEVPKQMVPQSVSTQEVIDRLLKQGVDIDVDDIEVDEMMTFFTPAFQPRGQDPIVPIMRDGKMKWYYVNPDLYGTLMGLDLYRLPKIADLILGVPTRVFRAGTTGLRAAFSLFTNPTRDFQTFIMQTQSHKNPARLAAIWTRSMASAFSPLRAIGRRDPYLDVFYRLGAQLGQPLGIDIALTRKTAKRLFRGKIVNTVTDPLNLVREILSLPESASRVAELRALADEVGWKPTDPITFEQAIQLGLGAKQVTTDFSAAGKLAKAINQAVPFFNAGIQGGRSFARAFKEHPYRSLLRGLLLITIPTLLLWWKNKGKDWYADMTDRERFMYWNIEVGEQIVQIPRAFEWGNIFAVIPEAIFDSWYRKDPKGVEAAMGHIYETTVPDVLPVTLRNAKEQWQNRIEFFDKPIVPRGEIDLPPGEQRGPYTSAVAKWLGQKFPDTISPRRVDALIRGFGGGVAPDLLNMIGLGGQRGVREREASDIPVFGKAFRPGGVEGLGSKALNEFYSQLSEASARAVSKERPETPAQRENRLILEDANKALEVLRVIQMEVPTLRGRQEIARTSRSIVLTAQDKSITPQERADRLESILARDAKLSDRMAEEVTKKQEEQRDRRRQLKSQATPDFNLPGEYSGPRRGPRAPTAPHP